MPKRLRNLRLKTAELLSIVDKGASGDDDHRPAIVLIKRAKERTMSSLKKKILEAVKNALSDVGDTDTSPTETLKAALKGVSVEKTAAIMAAILSKEGGDMSAQQLLATALADLPEDKAAAIMAAVAGMTQATAPAPAPAPEMDDPEKPEPPKPEVPESKADDAEPKPEDAMKSLEKLLKDPNASEELRKALTDLADATKVVTKAKDEEIAKLTKDAEDLSKRVDEAEDDIAKKDAAAQLVEQTEVAKSFTHVPGDVEKRAAVLLKVKAADQEAYEAMVASLGSANELLKSAKVYDEDGTSRPATAGTATAKLKELAKARAKETGQKYEVAKRAVSKENRKLYAESKAELH